VITQLKFVGIPTSDQDRALKFYTEKLGFEVSTDQVFGAALDQSQGVMAKRLEIPRATCRNSGPAVR